VTYIFHSGQPSNEERNFREREREVGGDGVSGCSFGQPLKQETFQTSLYIQTRA
jgi:hypothetical protein